MYSSSDFENLFIRYKAEAVPLGESIQDFCLKNNVPYNLFQKWYKDTRHRIVPVQVEPDSSVATEVAQAVPAPAATSSLRIMLDLRMSNGMHFQHRNLSYPDLKRLVEKLEVLC